jgi:uncharacterized membrane protein
MLIVLRLLHILLGAFWVGSAVFFALFLEPSIRAAGAAGGAVMVQVMNRKYSQIVASAAGLTVLTGLGMFFHDAKAGGPAWSGTPVGIAYAVGGVSAITALAFGLIVMKPTSAKVAALMSAGGPPSAEAVALLDKLQRGGKTVAALLAIALAAMAVARYL